MSLSILSVSTRIEAVSVFFDWASRLLLLLFLQRLLDLLRGDGFLLDENLTDSLLLRQCVIQRFARHDAAFDENFSEGFGLTLDAIRGEDEG